MSSSQRADCQTIRGSCVEHSASNWRCFMGLAKKEHTNSTLHCKSVNMMDCGKRQGLVFTLAESVPGMLLASLNYCLHVNIKLYKQPPGTKQKNTEIHIQGQPYLTATVDATKICICFESQISSIVHNLHNC